MRASLPRANVWTCVRETEIERRRKLKREKEGEPERERETEGRHFSAQGRKLRCDGQPIFHTNYRTGMGGGGGELAD